MTQDELLTNIKALMPDKGGYRNYQAFDRIGLEGQRPTKERWDIYGLRKYVTSDKTVLDLGCNIGCMALHAAGFAKEVYGVESLRAYVEIAEMIKAHLGIVNCHFASHKIEDLEMDRAFDVVLSLAVHPEPMKVFQQWVDNVYVRAVQKGGILLFESRKFRDKSYRFNERMHMLNQAGFKCIDSGVVRTKDSWGKPNQVRDFCIFERQ